MGVFEGGERVGEIWEMPRKSFSSGETSEASNSNGGHSPRTVLKTEDLVTETKCRIGYGAFVTANEDG